jgi:nucleolar protein 12
MDKAFSKAAPSLIALIAPPPLPPTDDGVAPIAPAATKNIPITSSTSRKRVRGGTSAAPAVDVDPAERLSRTLFIGGVPVTVTRKALGRFLARAAGGSSVVEAVRLRSVPIEKVAVAPGAGFRSMIRAAVVTGSVRADATMNAFAIFSSREAAALALTLNGELLGGAAVRVDWATKPSHERAAEAPGSINNGSGGGGVGGDESSSGATGGTRYDPKRTVFVGNLPYDANDTALRAAFASIADGGSGVEGIRIVRDRVTRLGKGFAFVLFTERATVIAALALDGKPCALLNNRRLRVTRASKDGKAPAPPKVAAAAAARSAGSAVHMGMRGEAFAKPASKPLAQKGELKISASFNKKISSSSSSGGGKDSKRPRGLRHSIKTTTAAEMASKSSGNNVAARAVKVLRPADRIAAMAAKKSSK